jgi:hypothetical protein
VCIPHVYPWQPGKRTEEWAKEVEGTALTINIVNPGGGANTPGMADEMRTMSRRAAAPRLVEPEEMVPPLLYVASREADDINGCRFDDNSWDTSLPPAQSARRAGFEMHPQIDLITRATVIPRGNQFGAGRHSVFSRGEPNAGDRRSMENWHAALGMS